jgi:hypothetical protein
LTRDETKSEVRLSAVSSPERAKLIWRLTKNGDVAQAKLYTLDYGQQLRVDVAGAEVFSCLFGGGRGADQLGALASTARVELESRGWKRA